MATGTLYEGDGFLRSGPVYADRPIAKAAAKPAERQAALDAESIEFEQREKALRREYLPEWVCKLLES